MCLYYVGVRYQTGWFRLRQRNPAVEPQLEAAAREAAARDAAAHVMPEAQQAQNNEDRHREPVPNADDEQVISHCRSFHLCTFHFIWRVL